MDAMDGIPPSYHRHRSTGNGSIWNDSRDSFFSRCVSAFSGRWSAAGSLEGASSSTQEVTSLNQGLRRECFDGWEVASPTLAGLQAGLRGGSPFEYDGMSGVRVGEAFEVTEEGERAYEWDGEGMGMDEGYQEEMEMEMEEFDPPPPYTPFETTEWESEVQIQRQVCSNVFGNPIIFHGIDSVGLGGYQFSSAPLGGMTEDERRALTEVRVKASKTNKRFNLDRVSSRVGKSLNSVKSRVRKLPQTTQKLQDGLRTMRGKGRME